MLYTIDRFEGDYAVCESKTQEMVNIPEARFQPKAKRATG
jgi:hypothetical protein